MRLMPDRWQWRMFVQVVKSLPVILVGKRIIMFFFCQTNSCGDEIFAGVSTVNVCHCN